MTSLFDKSSDGNEAQLQGCTDTVALKPVPTSMAVYAQSLLIFPKDEKE